MTPLSMLAIVLAGLVSLAAPLAIRPVLQRLGVMDVPNSRSSHTRPTLRGGGIAPLLGITVGGLAILAVPGPRGLDQASLLLVLLVAVAAALLGLVEDVKGLRVSVRAGMQLVLGLALSGTLVWLHQLHWPWLLLGAVGFAAYVNFTNFMDGINGISSLHGLVAGTAYALLGVITHQSWLTVAGLMVAAAFIAFLPWNLIPPGMFLGDVGSYLLGGGLAAMAIAALAAGIDPVGAVAPVAVYLTDTVVTLVRRAVEGEPIFASHRSHVYQRLTDTGLSHVAVASTVAALTAAIDGIGLAATAGLIPTTAAIPVIAAVLVAYLWLPRVRGYKQPRASARVGLVDIPQPPSAPARPSWSPRVWAVVGATGFIGSALAEHLEAEGADVRRVRSPRLTLDINARSAGAVAETAQSSAETTALARALAGAHVVINAAGAASPDSPASPELFGANALLPAVVAQAGQEAGCGRVIHLSSAAVQGNRQVLDATLDVQPFSPYSLSKALGERAFLASRPTSDSGCDLVVIRATSVQGPGRATTARLKRIAQSPVSSVAAPGTQPSVVSSLDGLVRFVVGVGRSTECQPALQLQPWEGLTAAEVLTLAGGKPPLVLPAWLCHALIAVGRVGSSLLPRLAGTVRRVEVMWFGQKQEGADLGAVHPPAHQGIRTLLRAEDAIR